MGAKLLMLGICTVTSRANSEVREPGITESQNKLDLNWAVLISPVFLIMSSIYIIIRLLIAPPPHSIIKNFHNSFQKKIGLDLNLPDLFLPDLCIPDLIISRFTKIGRIYIGRIMGGELQAE